MTRLADSAPRLDPAHLEGPIRDARWRVFSSANERYALAVTEFDCAEPALAVALAAVDGHPFDLDPHRFDRGRIRELRDVLTEWLERTA